MSQTTPPPKKNNKRTSPDTPVKQVCYRRLSVTAPVTPKFKTLSFLPSIKAEQLRLDVFHTVKTIGNGCFATVYLVEVLLCNEKFALKQQFHNSSFSFNLEMKSHWKILERLQEHGFGKLPALLPIFAAWCEQDSFLLQRNSAHPEVCCFLMPYCEKGSLQQDQVLPENEIWKLLYDMSRALVQLQSINIVHLDIKPENIMQLDTIDAKSDYQFKLADFGHAIDLTCVNNTKDLNQEGDSDFLAPELLLFNSPITTKVDIFSLGKTAGGLLGGEEGHSKILTALISFMTNEFPLNRPTASAIMELCKLQIVE
jgi:serine/threonine protein kinase